MAEGRAHAAYMDGALGRFGRNEFSILDAIDEETTEHIRANTEGGSYSSIGSGNKHDEHLPHATTVPPDVAATSSFSDGAAVAARLEEAAAPPCEEDPSLLRRIAVHDEDSSERRLVEGIERRADRPIHWQADAAPETVSDSPPPLPPPPTYEEALREASMAVDEEAVQAAAAAASAPQLLSPPAAPEQQQPQQDSSFTTLDDIVAEARRLGLDADFLSALPVDMALELLDEGRREFELLRGIGCNGGSNDDVDIERSLSALSTAEQGGPDHPDPAAMMEEDPPPFDYDVHAASPNASSSSPWSLHGRDDVALGQVVAGNDPRRRNHADRRLPPQQDAVYSSAESHHRPSSSSPPPTQGPPSRHQEEESFARDDDIASLRRTLTEAVSYASSSSPPTSLNGRWERHDPRRASPQSQSQPSQSQRTTRTTATNHNGGRRKRRKPSMMRAAIRDIAQRDAGWRASELCRLYGGDHGP